MAARRAPGGGRKPLPAEIHILRGNAGKKAIAAQADLTAKLEHGIPDPPRHLDTMERRHWRGIAAELHQLGVLAKTDRVSLEMLVVSYVRWIRARRMVDRLGEVLEEQRETGVKLYRNPWSITMAEARRELVRIAVEFGVTPSSRTKVAAVAAPPTPAPAGTTTTGAPDASGRYFGSA